MASMKAVISAVSEDTRIILSEILNEASIYDITVTNGNNIRILFQENSFDISITVLPLENEFGLDTCAYISKNYLTGQIILTPAKVYDEVCSRLSKTNTVIIPRSAPHSMILSAVHCTAAYKHKLDELINENELLKNKVSEIKLVNRAKCVLMEYLSISEKEAHSQMQRRAMNSNTTLAQIAANILKTYEYR